MVSFTNVQIITKNRIPPHLRKKHPHKTGAFCFIMGIRAIYPYKVKRHHTRQYVAI